MNRELRSGEGDGANIAAAKAALRTATLARRDAADPGDRARWSAAIRDVAAARIPAGASVAAFLPIRSEVDLGPLVHALAANGRAVGLPVIATKGLVFRAFRPGSALVPRGFGTVGPPDHAPLVDPEVMLVPFSVFDRRLHRIGYGKAHYDTTIAALHATGRRPILIGVGFALQEADAIPVESHDMALDLVVTEREVILPPGA